MNASLRRRGKTAAITLLVVCGVLFILAAAGTAYVWWTGREEPPLLAIEPTPTPATTPGEAALPDPDAPVGASVQSLLSPVLPGQNTTITVRSSRGATCAIVVEYNKVRALDSGLVPKETDRFGIVSWTWTVDPAAPVGTWPVNVTCARNEKTGFVRGDLQVVKELPSPMPE